MSNRKTIFIDHFEKKSAIFFTVLSKKSTKAFSFQKRHGCWYLCTQKHAYHKNSATFLQLHLSKIILIRL